MKNQLIHISLCSLFCFLLLFPQQVFEASKNGLLLWFDTLLPTLLPFLILSQLILKTPLIDLVEKILGPFFAKLFNCSKTGAFCIICGFLCGYPVGARLIALQIREQRLTVSEGQYLLSFCNNVSPMFCISYGIFQGIGTTKGLPYLLMVYGSAVLFGILTRKKNKQTGMLPTKKQTSYAESIFQLIDVCIIDSFLIMLKLCGYLILFSIICTGLFMLLPYNTYLTPLFAAFLEITGGLSLISQLPKGLARSACATAALSFGGLCCILQTNSVISNTGLSLKKYIVHKAVICLIALFLFFLWNFFLCISNGRC